MKKIFLHIGYPKCASTFLQRSYFRKIKNTHYVGHADENTAYKEWSNYVGACFETEYQDTVSRQLLTPMLRDDTLNIISDEGFLNTHSISLPLSRAKASFPDLHVLVCIRNQIDMISSIYRYMIGQGIEYRPVEDILIWEPFDQGTRIGSHEPVIRKYMFLELYKFDRVISVLQSIVGKDRVHAVCFERLSNPSRISTRSWNPFGRMSISDALPGPQNYPHKMCPKRALTLNESGIALAWGWDYWTDFLGTMC
jgi:hypothetical protein